ncbi:hypothetical protein ACU4GA_20750 [Methylobacterium oryzae CBMB20]
MVLGAISLDLFTVLLGGATALLPIYAGEVLHVGPLGLGALRSMPAFGAVAMAVLLANYPLRRHAGVRMLRAAAVFGAATVAFGLSTSLPLSMACLFVTGAADMISVYVRQTFVQGETPDAMRGRVSAVNTVFIGASNELGEFEIGAARRRDRRGPGGGGRRRRDGRGRAALGPAVPGLEGPRPADGAGLARRRAAPDVTRPGRPRWRS